MGELHHECGIAGAADLNGEHNVVPDVATMIGALNHRGGLAAGVAVPGGGRRDIFRALCMQAQAGTRVLKDNGRAQAVLTPQRLRGLNSSVAIGHNRYATSDSEDAALAQPWQNRSRVPDERFGFAWNGTIANAEELYAEELRRGIRLKTTCDTELLEHQILRGIQRHTVNDLAAVFADIERVVDGSFNVVLLTPKGKLAVYRDGQGRNPLETAVTNDGRFLVASENQAILTVMPDAATQPVAPGQLVVVRNGTVETTQVVPPDPRHCFFQWTYFSDWRSTLDGHSVGGSRMTSGKILAMLDTVAPEGSQVVVVPDSARLAGNGYAQQKNWPLLDNAIVNLLPGQRTFTLRDPRRTQKAKLKYGINREVLQGLSIVLVEDSLVRGTTMGELVQRLRSEGGVSQIHLRIACPPILAACFYGIDFPEIAELLARKNYNGTLRSGTLPPEVLQMIAARLGVDSIQFLPVEAVPLAIGCDIRRLCMACITGQYPTPCGQKRYEGDRHTIEKSDSAEKVG